MLRITNLSNAMQKRTLRVLHGQTQATPYAGTLDPRLRNTDGSFRAPLGGDAAVNSGLVRAAAPGGNAFTLQGGLVPGTCMVKAAGEGFVVGTATANVQIFGLLANFVGGTLDDLKDSNEIGVWYGPGSVYELLYPAFDDTGLATAYTNANAAATLAPVPLYCQPDGRLGVTVATGVKVAELIERRSAAVIQIKLLV
jgi:hypothetical protein